MEKITLAGASILYGCLDIKNAFATLNFDVEFIETASMIREASYKDMNLIKVKEKIVNEKFVVPLNEFWVSECIRTKRGRISEKALLASRSKYKLAKILCKDNIACCNCYRNFHELKEIIDQGSKVLLKPEGLYSGHGIKIVSKENVKNINEYIKQAKNLKKETKKVLGIKNTKCLFMEYIEGTEYSADIFWYFGQISVVRLCKKYIAIINYVPCVIAYQVVEITEEIMGCINRWMKVLFTDADLSFAQFDFIIDKNNKRIIPIDFSCRLGGGLKLLLMSTGINFYKNAILGKKYSVNTTNGIWTQFNYLPGRKGKIKKNYLELLPGNAKIYKHINDIVTDEFASCNNRIATVVDKVKGNWDNRYLLNELIIGDDYIE